mgnify:CR=1 FL=1
MLFVKTIKLLITISMVFLFACNQDNTSSGSSKSSISSYTTSSCKLDKMCDEYQRLVDKLMSATNSGDYTKIMNINEDVQTWLARWENEINQNSCTQAELLDASNRMMSIANSLY